MVTRKEFLEKTLAATVGMAASAVDSSIPAAMVGEGLSPPGAAAGFHDVCTSCGACADACPEHAIQMRPHRLSDKLLPVLVPAEKACVMCEETPCVISCGEGALSVPSHERFPTIGLAVVRTEFCLAHNGSTCMTCLDACPLKRTALKFKSNRPFVDTAACTGCGQCEYACPVEEKGIVVESI